LSICWTESFDDVAVGGCTSDAECSDGAFCNGDETCDIPTGVCLPGTPIDCNDGVSCTADSCNEATDSCDNDPIDTVCDNGLFCDGVETCDPVLDCQSGTAPDCSDGNVCTVDLCERINDTCVNPNVPDMPPTPCGNMMACFMGSCEGEGTEPVGGTYIPIDQSALLLAGAQSISMWMIPVLIAGIGIGVYVVMRRN